jgi:hypothetical protein
VIQKKVGSVGYDGVGFGKSAYDIRIDIQPVHAHTEQAGRDQDRQQQEAPIHG